MVFWPKPELCYGEPGVEYWGQLQELWLVSKYAKAPEFLTNYLTSTFFTFMVKGHLTKLSKICAWGVGYLLLLALPEIEDRDGIDIARIMYSQALQLLQPQIDAGFDMNTTAVLSANFLLGFENKYDRCDEDFKIYVYDNPSLQSVLTCGQGMFATEVFIHTWLQTSQCRTYDPEEADFFYFPSYAA